MLFCGHVEVINMERKEKIQSIRKFLCGIDSETPCGKCERDKKQPHFCRLQEKTDEQLDYILSSISENTYLEACAGSGKTEVLGIKAAYEIAKWSSNKSGIAVLTFTNEATNTIKDRILQLYKGNIPSNHYIGTFSSFIHGYISQKFGCDIFQRENNNKDKSFRLIENSTNQYDSGWLNTFKVQFPTNPSWPLFANNLYFKTSDRAWYIISKETPTSLIDYYKTAEMQNMIKKWEKSHKCKYTFEMFRTNVIECKKSFWNNGFATFEDMNLIAKCCLNKEEIRKKIALKFPLIIVDECQDLSKIELDLLSLLEDAGSVVHLIGDLNQSIYSFKDSYPEFISEHTKLNNFKTMYLTSNYRSTQKIVDISKFFSKNNKIITGQINSLASGQDCIYIEYNNENEAINKFEEVLLKYNIPFDRAVILVRGNDFKTKIGGGQKSDLNKHSIINALQLWNTNTVEGQRAALKLLGWQLQKWLKTSGRADNYYYCSEKCENTVMWRLFLRNILKELVTIESVQAFENTTYGEWYNKNKKSIIETINKHILLSLVNTNTLEQSVMRTPPKTSKENIAVLDKISYSKIRIETVHAVKGSTFDAVLFLSTKNAQGKSGYWENWLIPDTETMRIGYVACTRPRYFCCWGIHTLTDEQKETIEKIGLTDVASILS